MTWCQPDINQISTVVSRCRRSWGRFQRAQLFEGLKVPSSRPQCSSRVLLKHNELYIDCLWQLVESRYIRIVRGVWCRFWPLTLHIRHITCSYMSPCICAWFRQSTEDSLLAPEAKVSEAVWKQKAGLPAEQWCETSQCLMSMSWDVLRFGRHEVLLSCPLQRR